MFAIFSAIPDILSIMKLSEKDCVSCERAGIRQGGGILETVGITIP